MKKNFNNKEQNLMYYLSVSKKSLFRFEYEQYFANDDMSDESMKEWWSFIKDKTLNNITMQRVRLVILPMNEYTKSELKTHKNSVKYGDDIRVLYKEEFDEIVNSIKLVKFLENQNNKVLSFWLIDDNLLLKMKYNEAGVYIGFDTIYEQVEVEFYKSLKYKLWEKSVDLAH